MTAADERAPDAWLYSAKVDGGPWPGTILDPSRIMFEAPDEALTAHDAQLHVGTVAGGEHAPIPVTSVTIMGDGPSRGRRIALVGVAGAPLTARAGLLEKIMTAVMREAPVRAEPADLPPLPAPPALRIPPGPVVRPVIRIGVPGDHERPWYCIAFPWLCHPGGPHDPRHPEPGGPHVPRPGPLEPRPGGPRQPPGPRPPGG